MSGGDVELSYVACGTGLGIGIFPAAEGEPTSFRGKRVSDAYLLRLHEGIGI